MPYIKPQDKPKFEPALKALADVKIQSAGELNYLFSCIAAQYMGQDRPSYQRLNDVVGALDGAKVEFQRRVVAPYEDIKIAENGDVY